MTVTHVFLAGRQAGDTKICVFLIAIEWFLLGFIGEFGAPLGFNWLRMDAALEVVSPLSIRSYHFTSPCA